MPIAPEPFYQRLQQRQQNGLYRQRQELNYRQGNKVDHQGQQYLSFVAFDYLGLSQHPKVITALSQGAAIHGAGSSSSQLLGGHYKAHRELEQALAQFTGHERALIFSSGYMANLAVGSALLTEKDSIFHDKLNHASLIDASRSSPANFKRYHHLDMAHLTTQLEKSPGSNWICSDGVFSMDGDIAPLPQLLQLSQSFQAGLIIDDAHGFGVLGPQGGGISDYFHCDPADILILPFGKSLGTMGAAVLGSDLCIETILQFARTYIYTTALPPAYAEATLASLGLLQEEHWRRQHLQALIENFQTSARQMELPIMPSSTPIQSVLVKDAERSMHCAEQLKQRGILVSAIRPPTVPPNTSRLRINLTVHHSHEDISTLLQTLAEVYHET